MQMLTITQDLRAADAAAVRATVEIVTRITPADLPRPTPCTGWDLDTLLGHMIAQHRGFAAAAAGRGADPTVWQPNRAGADGVSRYAKVADDVLTAFAGEDVPDRPFVLPEFGTDRPFPGRMAVAFHLVDYVVHGWDVAHTLGVSYQPAPEVLACTLPIVRAVPDDAGRSAPGAPFGPARPVPVGADPLTEILLLLGRDPATR